MNSDHQCPKCSGEMERGFLRDRIGGGNLAVQWIAGAPEFSKFLNIIKIKSKVRYQIEVFRCKQCGYLEHYARERALGGSLFNPD